MIKRTIEEVYWNQPFEITMSRILRSQKKRKLSDVIENESEHWLNTYQEQLEDDSISPIKRGQIFEKDCMRKIR